MSVTDDEAIYTEVCTVLVCVRDTDRDTWLLWFWLYPINLQFPTCARTQTPRLILAAVLQRTLAVPGALLMRQCETVAPEPYSITTLIGSGLGVEAAGRLTLSVTGSALLPHARSPIH